MRYLTIPVWACTLLLLPMSLYANDHKGEVEEVDRLAMYRPYSGEWVSVTKTKVTDVNKQPSENKGRWVQSEILNDRIVVMDGTEEVGGKEYHYKWLITYDLREDAYVAWFHDERGVNSKMYGNWSEEERVMTWTLANPEEWGIMVTIVDDLSDSDRIGFTFKMEADDGTLILDQVGNATRAEE